MKTLHGLRLALLASSVFAATAVGAHELPLGDGNISTAPEVGNVYACQTRFGGGGAFRDGAWIGGDTWDSDLKPVVDGAVDWPSEISISLEGDNRIVRSNNLPDHPTGVFGIQPSDDAYAYDRNPNQIRAQDILLTLPANPTAASEEGCVPMGMIGFATSGAAIYNALDALGRDAAAHEIQDACNGHPERSGQYHYHDLSACLSDTRSEANGHSDLLGYALDGFGIYGLYGEDGEVITNDDLDACHGHVHEVMWDGQPTEIYHYHFTQEYPYTIGCFHGTPVQVQGKRRVAGGPPAGGTGPVSRPAHPAAGAGLALRRAVDAHSAVARSSDAHRAVKGPGKANRDNPPPAPQTAGSSQRL